MSATQTEPREFRVALTADFYEPGGAGKYPDIGLSVFNPYPHIHCQPFSEHRPRVGADQLQGVQGVIVLTPSVTAESVSQSDELLAVGRFGVGFDSVDVDACTAADVAVFITAGAVDRSVAEATVGWLIALTHHVRVKDRLIREGAWDQRSAYMGRELRDRTLGVIGLGGIARKLLELLAPFGMNEPLAFDPFISPDAARQLGVRLVDLDTLMASADFVSVHCPLNQKTRGLVGRREIGRLKPTAYLINTARGGIVDEDALYDALKSGQIAGAALDCFATEPVTTPSRFREFDTVLLAPHCIAWTDELFRDIGRAACQGMVDLSLQRVPRGLINPRVMDKESFRRKWDRLCGPENAS